MPRILPSHTRQAIAQDVRALLEQLTNAPYQEFPVTDRDVRMALAAIIQDNGID